VFILGVATDTDGNSSAAAGPSASVTVDNTAPTVNITDAPANLTNATSASFTFTGSDSNGIAAYECQLDSEPWAACTSPQSYNSLSDGTYTFAVRAIDNAGNTGNATSQSWTVDATAPTVSIGSLSESLTQSGPVTFPITIEGASTIALDASDVTLTSGDGVSGDISVSNGSTATPTITVNNLSGDGTFTISIAAGIASDNAGHTSAAAGPSASVTVDNTAPTVSIGSPSTTLTQSGPVTFPISIEGASTIALDAADVSLTTTGSVTGTVSVSGGTTDTPTITVSNLSGDGTFTINIAAEAATDMAGNLSAAAGPSASVTVDTALPVVSITAAPDDPTGSTEASISFTTTDSNGIATLECQLDGGAFEPCSSPVSYSGLSDGEHTVTVRATDNVGNSASASHTWTIDTALPTVSITAAPDDPSGSTEASISFTATDSSGIASLECQLDGGAFEPCSSPVSYTGLNDGEHTFTVRATDNVGNTGSASHTWTVDTSLPAAEAPRLYLPLVVRSSAAQPADAAPDLVGSVAIAPDRRSFAAGEPVAFTVTITNVGDAATEAGFWVDLYLNPEQVPTANQPWYNVCGLEPCHGIVWGVSEPLAPGESIVHTSRAPSYEADYTRWPGWLARGTIDVYVVVDSWNCGANGEQCVAGGAVEESDEDNNLTHLGGLEVTGENPASLLGAPVVAPRTAMP
jgi:hypothetical protein